VKRRADELLVAQGLAASRARAKAEIAAGHVRAGTTPVTKPAQLLDEGIRLTLHGANPYVSRGGLKLAHALDTFAIAPAGAIALDIGASTGGFTDVLLRRGVARVYAVDVGQGQFAEALACDRRVVLMERTDARTLTREHVPDAVDLVVADVSFIALAKALPQALALAVPGATLVALVKPQFEAGPEHVGKGGIVKDPAVHRAVCAAAGAWLDREGWHVNGIIESPITGGDGNTEFLLHAGKR